MLIEGLKRLRVILKRIDGNTVEITRYASKLSTEKGPFESEETQKDEVKGRIQSNLDLVKEYLALKGRVDRTNRATMITAGGTSRSLADWLLLKRQLGQKVVSTYQALNTSEAERHLRSMQAHGSQERVTVEQLYDEGEKNKALRRWMDDTEEFDAKLEVVNATTALVD